MSIALHHNIERFYFSIYINIAYQYNNHGYNDYNDQDIPIIICNLNCIFYRIVLYVFGLIGIKMQEIIYILLLHTCGYLACLWVFRIQWSWWWKFTSKNTSNDHDWKISKQTLANLKILAVTNNIDIKLFNIETNLWISIIFKKLFQFQITN